MAKQQFLMIRVSDDEKALAAEVAARAGVRLSVLIRRYIKALAARQARVKGGTK